MNASQVICTITWTIIALAAFGLSASVLYDAGKDRDPSMASKAIVGLVVSIVIFCTLSVIISKIP